MALGAQTHFAQLLILLGVLVPEEAPLLDEEGDARGVEGARAGAFFGVAAGVVCIHVAIPSICRVLRRGIVS